MQVGSFQPLGIGSGSLIQSRYELDRRLGAGAMSAVFSARDRALNNQIYALKILKLDLSHTEEDVARFRNEVLITRKLSHQNIVRTYEFGELGNGQFFIVMEYIPGTTLHEMIYRPASGRPSLKEILYCLKEVALGVGYAHANDVIHRDLKPANVLVSEQSVVKIVDFGLAYRADQNLHLTQTGHCVGTPAYMSPEQVQGQAVSHLSDIYALGVLAYESYVGKLPFASDNWFELATSIVNSPMPSLKEHRADVPDWFQAIIEKATAKAPEERFQSTEEFANVITAHLEQGTVVDISKERTIQRDRRRATLSNSELLTFLTRSAPIALGAAVVFFIIVMLLGHSEDSVKAASKDVGEGTQVIQSFTSTLQRLNQVIVATHKNKDKIDAFLKQVEEATDEEHGAVNLAPVEPPQSPDIGKLDVPGEQQASTDVGPTN